MEWYFLKNYRKKMIAASRLAWGAAAARVNHHDHLIFPHELSERCGFRKLSSYSMECLAFENNVFRTSEWGMEV